MVTKNQICEKLEISGLTSEGLGVGKHKDIPIFIKGAAPGDVLTVKIVKTERSHAYGAIQNIDRRSPFREDPPCLVYEKCGGCSLQHISYDAQIAAKEVRAQDSLRRIGGFSGVKVDEVIAAGNPYRYRNKSVFPVKKDHGGQAAAGLYAAHSHRFVPVRDCHIAHPGVSTILRSIESYINSTGIQTYDEASHTGLIRHIMVRTAFATGDVMVVIVANGSAFPHVDRLLPALINKDGVCSICINVNQERTNVIMGSQTNILWGDPYIREVLCGTTFAISAPSFFQVNTAATELLYEKVLEMAELTASKTLIDAYCGIGAISLIAARRAAGVIGIESSESAVEDARTNAKLNGITNADFAAGKTEDVLSGFLSTTSTDVVILDPPRKGCDPAVIAALRSLGPERVIYVSCDPATLARDLKGLCADGLYTIKRVIAADMFPQTPHIETAVLLIRGITL